MNEGTKVNVLGVHRSLVIECEDEDCQLKHYDDRDSVGRYHYEDGPREGRPGTVGATYRGHDQATVMEGDRIVVTLDDGSVVSCDAVDVEVIA